MKPSKKAQSSSDIRLRAKPISQVERSLNHRAPASGIPFVNTAYSIHIKRMDLDGGGREAQLRMAEVDIPAAAHGATKRVNDMFGEISPSKDEDFSQMPE